MTGLDVEKERIIEVGAIITDTNLSEISVYETAVKQPLKLLKNMDEWNAKHHKESGLMAKIPYGKTEEQTEQELSTWCKEYFNEPIIIAGNSIAQDRLFLEKYFKNFSKLLHYRQLDVTAFKLAFAPKGMEFKKQNSHRAIDDIKESIAEFKFFMSHFNK